MSGSTRTLCEGLNRSLASVRAVMSIPSLGIAKQNRERRLSTQRARLCSPRKQTLVLTSGHILSSVIRSSRCGRLQTSGLQAQPFQARGQALSVGPVALLQLGQEMAFHRPWSGPALQLVPLDLVADLDVGQDDERLLELRQEVIRVERHLRTIHSRGHRFPPCRGCLCACAKGPSCTVPYSELV